MLVGPMLWGNVDVHASANDVQVTASGATSAGTVSIFNVSTASPITFSFKLTTAGISRYTAFKSTGALDFYVAGGGTVPAWVTASVTGTTTKTTTVTVSVDPDTALPEDITINFALVDAAGYDIDPTMTFSASAPPA